MAVADRVGVRYLDQPARVRYLDQPARVRYLDQPARVGMKGVRSLGELRDRK